MTSASYTLETLPEPISRGGSPKDFVYLIRRNFETDVEPAGTPVFYLQNDVEAKETLEKLLSST